MRVHALAKQLSLTSKELISALDGMGLKKVAQSTISREEALALLDALAAPDTKPETPEPEAPAEPEEKIRIRVRKNVENEIHQIEEKVEADLAAVVEEHIDEEPLEDIEPAITPAPESIEGSAVEQFTPVFMPPGAATETPVEEETSNAASRRRRRGRRGASRGRGAEEVEVVEAEEAAEVAEELPDEPTALRGSTRLEAQRRRRTELREEGRKKRHIVSQAEFLARRESVERTMVVRERERHDSPGLVTQVGVLEDELLVEHFVTSEAQASMIGNIYLGRVQNVLPSMEAAFIDIGQGRNGVLYAGEVDWKSAGLGGRSRRIEQALKSGDQVLVQVSKDPLGHKGARLTTQISLAGRYLVYVPGGRSAGISRKLPGPERARLKEILTKVVPGQGGAIIRTAAEGVSEEAIAADVNRLHSLWEDIRARADKETHSKGSKPITMYEEPNMLVKVVRDLYNEDFSQLVVDGGRAWNTVHAYVQSVAPDLLDRVVKYDRAAHGGVDAFEHYRIDEQIQKALSEKVWLPSGGTLIIERTEAMTVVDVNTGKFTGSGGNLEETVTRNNLEAAEEIVRQMRLRDMGGMIVVDFIDMVLPENQELVLRRLKEALGRDRTRHQVSEVTSLGLVQMTRKRLGTGLLETFSTECEHCAGRGIILHEDPVEEPHDHHEDKRAERRRKPEQDPTRHPAAVAMQEEDEEEHASIEELAAAVVVDEPQEKPKRSRRSRRSAKAEKVEDSFEKIVSDAVELADAEDPEEPSGASYVPAEDTGEKTFQQAVEEFETSPRRRRKTRGNSRSDRRPQPEDFPGSASTAPAAQLEDEKERSDARRSRRRTTRSNRPNRAVAEQEAPQQEEKSEETTVVRRTRGRRRVVRRTTTSEIPAQAPQADVDKQEAPKRASRGRRRVTRRTSAR
ncbi:translation initiation factor IF-2 N-terminal domain-containing protein [Corynebacterium atrinae]|uniref:translation initiation factor IF-2 N-terminal domain-containing protein n=1 Tax=Corynebacterium atrinae TaxID=1336740 RepID=UPI0025B5B101|nr:translation initiation factor IF-2 N-terminal domain-containing protein [Corynebacterium atrinae]